MPDAIPPLLVEADGRPLPAEHARALGSLRIQHRLSQPSLCELGFLDPEGELARAEALLPGVALTVRLADEPDEPLFEGEVTALELVYEPHSGRIVRVRGYDRLHRLRKRQPIRSHADVDAEGLARALLTDEVDQIDATASGPRWPHLIQHGQTDLELLQQVCERAGLHFHLWGTRLRLFTLEGHDEAETPLELGSSLLEARFELNADRACDRVVAHGWGSARVVPGSREASRRRSGRTIDATVRAGDVGGDGEVILPEVVGDGDGHAEAAAQAELDARAASETVLDGTTLGNPALRPGVAVRVRGVAEPLQGRYVLSSVTHVVDARSGFLTEITTEPPAVPSPPSPHATLGVVSAVDDPRRSGRVRVRLPAYGDVETDWMQVVAPGAGQDKGLVAIPDVGDEVLVLPLHGDPGHGIVIGGLYGRSGPEDPGVELGRVRRFRFHTPSGHQLVLDDHSDTLRIEDGTGSYVEMSPRRVTVHAERDLVLQAPGHEVRIRGQLILFERA